MMTAKLVTTFMIKGLLITVSQWFLEFITWSKKRAWMTREYTVSATRVGKSMDLNLPLKAELATSWNQKTLITLERQKRGSIQRPPNVYDSSGRRKYQTLEVRPDSGPRDFEIKYCSIGINMYSKRKIEAWDCVSLSSPQGITHPKDTSVEKTTFVDSIESNIFLSLGWRRSFLRTVSE